MKLRLTPLKFAVAAASLTLVLGACTGSSNADGAMGTAVAPSGSIAPTAQSNGVTKITMAYMPIYTAGILQLAQDLGYFDDAHLDVTLTPVDTPAQGTATLLAGGADVTYSTSIQLIRAVSGGINMRVLAPADGFDPQVAKAAANDPSLQRKLDDTAVLAAPHSGITSLLQLPGKLVAVPATGGQLEVTIRSAVHRAGGDASKINWVILTMPETVAALASGKVDAGGLVDPYVAQAQKVGAKIFDYPGYQFFGDEPVTGLWLTTQSFVDAHPAATRALQAALVKANAYAMAHQDEFYTAAAAITHSTVDELKALAVPYFPTTMTDQDFTRVSRRMLSEGEIDSPADVTNVIVK